MPNILKRNPVRKFSKTNSVTRRRKMNYAGERVIQVSMDNLRSWIEAGLRTFKEIPNSQSAEVSLEHVGLTIKEWNKLDVVPVRLKLKETEAVEIHRQNDKDG
jgi:hypothetical protein